MCGINGLINIGSENLLKCMNDSIAHRGPDNDGIKWFAKHRSGLGHRRLSIIDLSADANQPMTNNSKRLWITYNGELYNYLKLRSSLEKKGYSFRTNSDTEVILKSYEIYGIECLKYFNGMYAFAIYDSLSGKLFAARDQVGVKPLYYTVLNDSLIFSSEIKAILQSKLVAPEPDYFSLFTPTRFQISPYTGFNKILKLPPGHYLVYENGKIDINRYWDIKPEENQYKESETIELLDDHLKRTISLQMTADVEVGAFLSGGLDSSLITALMKTQTNKTIKTFTIKFSNEDQKFEQMSDDSRYARKVADHFDFDHTEIEIKPDVVDLLPKMVWHLDEPISDPAAINTFLIAKAARDAGIIVLLNGMGGDEVFGGYRKHLACLKADTFKKYIPGVIQQILVKILTALPTASFSRGFRNFRWAKRFASFATLPRIERFLSSDLSMNPYEYLKAFNTDIPYDKIYYYQSQKDNFSNTELSYLTQMCLNDTKVFLPEHNLTYSDKATMSAGVESRPPFTDHELVTFMFNLSPNFRINGNQQKYILKKVAERYLPKEIVYRPKASFGSPLRSWVRGPLREMIDDYVNEATLRKRQIYNSTYILKKIEADRKGEEDNALFIWEMLSTEIWFRTFFDS